MKSNDSYEVENTMEDTKGDKSLKRDLETTANDKMALGPISLIRNGN